MSIEITVQGGTSKKLLTGGKYCPEDIVVTAEGGGSGASIETFTGTVSGGSGLGDIPDMYFHYTDETLSARMIVMHKNEEATITVAANTLVVCSIYEFLGMSGETAYLPTADGFTI